MGRKLDVPAPPGHHVLVQVGGHAGPRDRALVHPEVESPSAGTRPAPARPMPCFVSSGELHGLLVGEVDVEGDVAVGADEHVTRVVGEEVEHDVARARPRWTMRPSSALGAAGSLAERAALTGLLARLLAADVDHPVRGPQALEAVRLPGSERRRPAPMSAWSSVTSALPPILSGGPSSSARETVAPSGVRCGRSSRPPPRQRGTTPSAPGSLAAEVEARPAGAAGRGRPASTPSSRSICQHVGGAPTAGHHRDVAGLASAGRRAAARRRRGRRGRR